MNSVFPLSPASNDQQTRMKFITAISLLFLSATAFSQDVVIADNGAAEPIGLYRKVNESLTCGNTKLALDIFEDVIKFFEEEGRLNELPANYLGMALSLALNGHYPESIRYHKKALKAHRKYSPRESADEIRMNLGFAYQLAGKERKAKRYLN
jgi:tetratricopeptide (TPR) repeat protein